MLNDDETVLEDLEGRELVIYNEETGLPTKTASYKHLRPKEVAHVLLPHIVENIKVSNRELSRITGFDSRTISKTRSSDFFLQLLAEYTNQRMIGIRSLALEKLEKLLLNPKTNDNTLVKGIALALAHSEKMAEIAIATQATKEVDVSALIKELENM